ncbi:MAG TPA: acetyl-CoA carboxylase biotin carboxyl carrier protein subunit [Terriglobales bacterium]|jgi:biotin carboxyl carrier protein|nr:acetyl-CoA carboxylase biotin carboxyl carrier protein subunit [Terriglobales bacterium]
MRFSAFISGKEHQLEIIRRGVGFECRIDGNYVDIDLTRISSDILSILYEGKSYEVRRGVHEAVTVRDNSYQIQLTDPRSWRSRNLAGGGGSGPQKLTASMPGKVVRVLANAGVSVHAGQGVLVIEAMKMQNELRAPRDGTIASIQVKEGQAVNAGEVVAIID